MARSARTEQLPINLKELTSRPLPEMNVTQEMRQQAFDNWETTGGHHGMVIYGVAKDQNGKEYFMVKNSWGLSGEVQRNLVCFKGICCLQDDERPGT